MTDLIPVLTEHFNALQDRMESFCRHGVQLEGWLKGELLAFLDAEKSAGRIRDLDREVKLGGGRIDLLVTRGEGRHWVELKQWLVGVQRGYTWKPSYYFGDTQIGMLKDVDKLLTAPERDRCWILILLCANPGVAEWNAGVEVFNQKFAPRRLTSRVSPASFPASYSLGLLDVRR